MRQYPPVSWEKRNNQERLSSNEIIFLWSLLVKKEGFWQYPSTVDELYAMRCEIPQLMEIGSQEDQYEWISEGYRFG